MFPITKLELFNKSLSEIYKDNKTFNDISESTKAVTTEVQTITLRKKTNAQKCREYRERKKLQNTMVPKISAERSECSETDQLQGKKPKTNAERRKKHYEAQKLKRKESKKIPKTAKQRSKEYYYRKKKIQALNTLNHHSDVSIDNCTAKICPKIYPEEILKNAEEKQQNNSFHVPYQQFKNCAQPQDHLVQNQVPPDSSSLDSLVDVKVCRVCLAMDVKMYDMSNHQLNIMFERVTGIEMNTGNKLPQKLCWECVARLASANSFVEKVLKTQWILFNIINSRKFTVMSGMESIKETRNQLKPTLSKVSRVDDYYLDIIEKSTETIIENSVNDKEEANSEFEEIQIKNEHLDIDFEVAVVEDEVNDGIYGVKMENNFEEFDMKVENLSDDISQENQSEIQCGKMEVILPDEHVHDYKQHNHIVNSTTLSKNTDQIYDPEKFICDLCGKMFKRKSIFINHIFKHPKTYTCSHCAYTAPNKTRYNQHINARHTKTISFKCSLCSYTTNLKQSLSRHVNNRHNNKDIYKCPLCNFKTYNDKSLGKHVSARHTHKMYKCSLCNYTANIKYCLAKHVSVVHNKSKSFKCSTCNFKSFYKTSLDRHVKLFHS